VLVSLAFTRVFVDIGGVDPVIIGAATGVLAGAAAMASAIPARRAAKVEPLSALRAE
jgi:ABC-type lipoprotein release transport system permease subunit